MPDYTPFAKIIENIFPTPLTKLPLCTKMLSVTYWYVP